MNGSSIRQLANNFKEAGLSNSWTDFSVRYCARSPYYLQHVKPQTNVSRSVVVHIKNQFGHLMFNLGPNIARKFDHIHSQLTAI
jgi:hypothetical protein